MCVGILGDDGIEEIRPSAGYTRPADPEDTPSGLAAWLCHSPTDLDHLARDVGRSARLPVPGAAPAGAQTTRRIRVARVRKRENGEVLLVDQSGPQATHCGTREVAALFQSH